VVRDRSLAKEKKGRKDGPGGICHRHASSAKLRGRKGEINPTLPYGAWQPRPNNLTSVIGWRQAQRHDHRKTFRRTLRR